MPQFFYNFAADAAGSVPAGWARGGAWGAGQLTNVDNVAGATGGRAVVPDFTGGGSATGILRCTDVGDTAGAVEIIARVRNVPAGVQVDIRGGGVGVRYNDTGLNGYGFWRIGGFFGLVEHAGAGDYGTFRGSGLQSAISDNQAWYWQRLRVGVTGANQIQAWVAPDVAGQPGAWQGVIVSGGNSITDATRTNGFVGIRLWQFNQLLTVDVVGIGTAGDAAPTTEPVAGGPLALGTPSLTSVARSTISGGLSMVVVKPLGALTLASGGRSTLAGGLQGRRKFWRVPSNAPVSTAARMVVFNSGTPANAVAQEGTVAADASGNFDLATSDAAVAGSSRLAVVHNWNGVGGTSNIIGGPGIAMMNEVNT